MEEEKTQLQEEISKLEEAIKPKRDRLNEIHRIEAEAVEERIKKAERGNGDFTLGELRFAATSRCTCGAGYAYPLNIGIHGSWYCSAILMGKAERGSTHQGAMPFAFYEVKSERQPSANGATTRPE